MYRHDFATLIEQRLPDRQEVADRGLRGGRQFAVAREALVKRAVAVKLGLALHVAGPAAVQAHDTYLVLSHEGVGKIVSAVGGYRDLRH